MAPPLRYAVFAAGLLALCCIVTIHVNDESIKAEAAVAREHNGMMYEREDSDTDDLSESDRELIEAAGDQDDDFQTVKFSELQGVHNAGDKKRKGEDAEDDLSADDVNLINAANKSPVKTAKKEKKLKKAAEKFEGKPLLNVKPVEEVEETEPETTHKHADSDSDDLDDEDQALINAAAHHTIKKAPKASKKLAKKHLKKVVPTPKLVSSLPEAKQQSLREEVAATIKSVMSKTKTHVKKNVKLDKITKPWHEMDRSEQKLSTTDDDLSPAERSLIDAARNEDPSKLQRAKLQLGVGMENIEEKLSVRNVPMKKTDAQIQKSVMKKAMEKITKRASQNAVMAATITMPELHAPGVDLKKTLQSMPTQETAAQTFKNDALKNARAIVYGTPVQSTLAKMHTSVESSTEHEEAPEATLKSVEDMRHEQQLKLQQKFHDLETQSSKASQSSWEEQLQAADHRAAMMAQHHAMPLSPMEISRAHLMRKQLAAQYRADAAATAPEAYQTVTTGSMDAHAFITGSLP